MSDTTTLLQHLAIWAELHPLALVAFVALLPLVVIGVAEVTGWGWGEDAEPEAPAPAGAPELPPAGVVSSVAPQLQLELELPASPAEPKPAADPEPAARLQPEPESASPPVPEPEPRPLPAPVRLSERLRRTREGLVGRLTQILSGRQVDADVLDDLEAVLLGADLGAATVASLLETVRSRGQGGDADAVRALLRDEILAKLKKVDIECGLGTAGTPHVILVLGVNGTGKTTSIGKLAARYVAGGRKVVLGAGDTFRAAAREQLQVWGDRVGCEVIGGPDAGDPSAVAFDTVRAALSRGADVAIIDTAGRLQTKKPLMEELGKMVRVIGKGLKGAPHETLLVLDANTGQNAISQAEIFTEVAGVTGLVLTKLDGTAKGGVLVGLADKFGIPVRFVGVGEAVEDLRDFQAEEFVDALFGDAD